MEKLRIISEHIYEKVKKEVSKGLTNGVNEVLNGVHEVPKETINVASIQKLVYDEIKNHNLGVYFPLSISVNNCVGYNTSTNYDIQLGDIVKVEFGVSSVNSLNEVNSVMFGKTFVAGKEDDQYVKFLDELYIKVKAWFRKVDKNDSHFYCTDSLRQLIESECAEARCFPVKNCLSMQQEGQSEDEYAPNYFYLNYTKEYDKMDYLIGMENLNFDVEKGDIYDINITIVPDGVHDGVPNGNPKYIYGDTTIFQLNQYKKTSLTLKAARILYNTVKKEYNDRPFDFNRLDLSNINLSNIKSTVKAGLRECVKKGLFEEYPVMYIKDNIPVYHLKATFVKGRT